METESDAAVATEAAESRAQTRKDLPENGMTKQSAAQHVELPPSPLGVVCEQVCV